MAVFAYYGFGVSGWTWKQAYNTDRINGLAKLGWRFASLASRAFAMCSRDYMGGSTMSGESHTPGRFGLN